MCGGVAVWLCVKCQQKIVLGTFFIAVVAAGQTFCWGISFRSSKPEIGVYWSWLSLLAVFVGRIKPAVNTYIHRNTNAQMHMYVGTSNGNPLGIDMRCNFLANNAINHIRIVLMADRSRSHAHKCTHTYKYKFAFTYTTRRFLLHFQSSTFNNAFLFYFIFFQHLFFFFDKTLSNGCQLFIFYDLTNKLFN